jgi:hypothetical protein
MADAHPQSELVMDEASVDATEVRFSIRALLVATAYVAIGTTALGAFLRRFPPEAQVRLFLYWGLLALIFISLILYHARRRQIAERRAGRVLFSLVPHSYLLPRNARWATVAAGLLLLIAAPLAWVLGSFAVAKTKIADWISVIDLPAVGIAAANIGASGTGLTILWWRRVKFATNGVLIRNRFIAWKNYPRWYWDAFNNNVVVLESTRSTANERIAAKTNAEGRSAIEALLTDKIGEPRKHNVNLPK